MKSFAITTLCLGAFALGASVPNAAAPLFVNNCQITIQPPAMSGKIAAIDLQAAGGTVSATIDVPGDGLLRLRPKSGSYFVDEDGNKLTEPLRKGAKTVLRYRFGDETSVLVEGEVNGVPIRPVKLVVGKRKQGDPFVSRIGEDYAGNGRSTIRFDIYRKTVQFLLEDV